MAEGALIFRPGTPEPEYFATLGPGSHMAFLQRAVGGLIGKIPHFETVEHEGRIEKCHAFCSAEGRLRLAVNVPATLLWDAALKRITDELGQQLYPHGMQTPDWAPPDALLFGPVVVVFGEQPFVRAL